MTCPQIPNRGALLVIRTGRDILAVLKRTALSGPVGLAYPGFFQETAVTLCHLLSVSVALALFQLFLVILVAAAIMLFRKTWDLRGRGN